MVRLTQDLTDSQNSYQKLISEQKPVFSEEFSHKLSNDSPNKNESNERLSTDQNTENQLGVEERTDTICHLNKDLLKFQSEVTELSDQNKSLKKSLKISREKFSEADSDRLELVSEYNLLKNSNEELKAQLSSALNGLKSSKAQLVEIEKQVSELRRVSLAGSSFL